MIGNEIWRVTLVTYNIKNAFKFFFVFILKLKYIANDHMYGFKCSHKSSNMIPK